MKSLAIWVGILVALSCSADKCVAQDEPPAWANAKTLYNVPGAEEFFRARYMERQSLLELAIRTIKLLDKMEDPAVADNPAPIRYAMMILGDWRAPAGVPVLLDHIDYAAVPVEIRGARPGWDTYWAVTALSQIGVPAAAAAMDRLENETNLIRVGLMGHVIDATLGTEIAGSYVQSTIDQEKAAHPDSRKLKNLLYIQNLMKRGLTSDFGEWLTEWARLVPNE